MIKETLAQLNCVKELRIAAATATFVVVGLLALCITLSANTSPTIKNNEQSIRLFEQQNAHSVLPVLLSAKDKKLYQDIFGAQRQANWKKADWLIKQLTNKKLLGHVLAERYLHDKYRSKASELKSWLEAYPDHPQAKRVYTLALKKNPKLELPVIKSRRILSGYGDDSGLARWQKESSFATTWNRAIAAWRNKETKQAAGLFAKLAKTKKLHTWKKSASAFWAWRSYQALGNSAKAKRYLTIAASHPRTFYGILARKQLGQTLALHKEPTALSDSDVLEVIGEKAIRRIISLSRIGAIDLADKEIRFLFPRASKEEKHRLLTIANSLNLASSQIAMARQLATSEERLDFARYPVPNWQPHTGFSIDPALIYAMARQESGFRAQAVSHVGATGIMQLMPNTVSLMKKRVMNRQPKGTVNANEPATNVTLGQSYIEHLLDIPLVENNLLYLLTAYNAGPGRLQKWKKNITYRNDPLLFLESIPYGETRSYVMQVMANYWIYSELIGRPTQTHLALLQNQWPSYEPLITPVALVQRDDIAS